MITIAFILGIMCGAVAMVHIYAIILKWQFKELGIPTYRDRDGCKYKMVRLEKRVVIMYEVDEFNQKKNDL